MLGNEGSSGTIANADITRNTDFLVALEKRIVELPVGVAFALQHGILDRGKLLLVEALFFFFDARGETLFALQCLPVALAAAGRNAALFTLDRIVERFYLLAQ